MSQPLKAMLFFMLVAIFSFLLFDINKNLTIKQDAYETLRASNQNSLLDLNENYSKFKQLNTPAMLEQWLVNFINNNNIKWQDVELEFIQIETDPPLYLVGIQGYVGHYAVISKDTFIQYHSGSMIITEGDIDDDSGSDPITPPVIPTPNKTNIVIPSVTGSFTYNGKAQTPKLNYDNNNITATGDIKSKTNVGVYSITFSLNDTNKTQWSDGTCEPKTISWSIAALKLSKPTAKNTQITQGLLGVVSKEPDYQNYNSTYITKSGDGKQRKKGTYKTTFSLKNTSNTTWDDGTTDPITIVWTIK